MHEKRRGFSTRLVMRDIVCAGAQGLSRADQSEVNRFPGVTPKRQKGAGLASVFVVLRTPAALEIVGRPPASVKSLQTSSRLQIGCHGWTGPFLR
jgi:hypothetical protein